MFLTLSLTTVTLTVRSTTTSALPLTQTISLQHSTSKGFIAWGSELRANNWTSGDQHSPDVCSFSDCSGFVVVWASNQTGDNDVYFRLFNSTGYNQTGDILVNTNTSNDQVQPSVSCHSDGFVVVWQSAGQDGSGNGVYAKVFDYNGTSVTGEIPVNGYINGNQEDASVSCFDNGYFVVAWGGVGQGDNEGVFAKVFNAVGNNITDDILVNTNTLGTQRSPSVSCAGNESFVITWDYWTYTYDYYDVHAKLFNSSGGNQTGEILVNGETYTDQDDSSVCCFSDGSFVVAWFGRGPGDPLGIFARVFDPTGQYQTGDILVDTYLEVPTYQWEPSVYCFSDDSGFVVTWSSDLQDGSDSGVYARVFNSYGQSLTGEARVNKYTSNDQMRSSVSCFENGSFVVVWQSSVQDTSGWGVYFRVGNLSSTSISALPLLAVVLGQSGTGLSLTLLIGGGLLAAAVVLGTIVFWRSRRGT